jgi:hypothetical protein
LSEEEIADDEALKEGEYRDAARKAREDVFADSRSPEAAKRARPYAEYADAHGGENSSTETGVMADGHKQSTVTKISKHEIGLARAVSVEEIRQEIYAISRKLELQEDYDANIRGGKGKTVSVCDQHKDLCDKLCLIKTTKKPKIVALACEIAARVEGSGKSVLPETFRDAHKRYGARARQQLGQRQ